MEGIAFALILTGAVLVRGALKGLTPLDSIKDVFDRSRGGTGIVASYDIEEFLPDITPEDAFLVGPSTSLREEFPR